MQSPERQPLSQESNEQLSQAAAERAKELLKNVETGVESPEHSSDASQERQEVAALFEKEAPNHEKKRTSSGGSARKARSAHTVSKKEKEAGFRSTMKDVQAHLSPSSRTFSRFIHNAAVEKVSDTAANTVARPNIILAGGISAFAVVLVVYVVARNYGYPLSGAESIAAFIVGWIIGALFDFFRVMITGKRS